MKINWEGIFAKSCTNNSNTAISQDSEEADEDFEDVGDWEDENLF